MAIEVLIVAEHASLQFGGEAAIPVHYFRILRRRQIPVWLVVHERTRRELESLFPADSERIVFVKDTRLHVFLWQLGKLLPDKISNITTGFLLRLMTQHVQRREARRLLREHPISIIHQPIPVSPKEPSMIYGMGVPVIIGPMNGGIEYPPGFRKLQDRSERVAVAVGRSLANVMNFLMPGKRQAAKLLVANDRTRAALPRGVSRNVALLVENGVELQLWSKAKTESTGSVAAVPCFVFMGRLVEWKAVDLLLLAFKRACAQTAMTLSIIGGGVEHRKLEQMARDLNILGDSERQTGKVCFLGWMSQKHCAAKLATSDALVLPSLAECGGAVVLEAMSMEVPVIATAWGGPADYLDPSCGILVDPSSEKDFVENFARGLIRLATRPEDRQAMGKAGRLKVIQKFDWERKIDEMLEHYESCIMGADDLSLLSSDSETGK